MADIEQLLEQMYEELLKRHPEIASYKIWVHQSILDGMGWKEGQLVTKYKLPVVINPNIQEIKLGDNTFQSDI